MAASGPERIARKGCTKCGRLFTADFRVCPYDGVVLVSRSRASAGESNAAGPAEAEAEEGLMWPPLHMAAVENPPESAIGTQVPTQIPTQIVTQIAAQVPFQIAAQLPAQVPAQIPVQVPVQVPVQIPAQVPVQIPAQVPAQMPAQVPAQMPAQFPAQIPGQVPVQVPVQIPVQFPGRVGAETPTPMGGFQGKGQALPEIPPALQQVANEQARDQSWFGPIGEVQEQLRGNRSDNVDFSKDLSSETWTDLPQIPVMEALRPEREEAGYPIEARRGPISIPREKAPSPVDDSLQDVSLLGSQSQDSYRDESHADESFADESYSEDSFIEQRPSWSQFFAQNKVMAIAVSVACFLLFGSFAFFKMHRPARQTISNQASFNSPTPLPAPTPISPSPAKATYPPSNTPAKAKPGATAVTFSESLKKQIKDLTSRSAELAGLKQPPSPSTGKENHHNAAKKHVRHTKAHQVAAQGAAPKEAGDDYVNSSPTAPLPGYRHAYSTYEN
jgi:hypothetical protein